MGSARVAYPMRILCCLKRLLRRDERENNLNKKHFLKAGDSIALLRNNIE